MSCNDEDILREQAEYYRQRVGEYDDWFWRVGRFDRGERATRRWFAQVDEVRRAVKGLPLDGRDVLELAAGTGIWTSEICDRVAHLTAVDASREMIRLNRARLGARAQKVTFIEADLFEWAPPCRYDAVVFCFWISHIPVRRLDGYLADVAAMLSPGGVVFFLDSRREHVTTVADLVLPPPHEEVIGRRLDDGREFNIIKNFCDRTVLEEKCRGAGLDVRVSETADFFQFDFGARIDAR